jgi:outer membrane protein assembly factor BamD (BamD/ComL family)
MRRATKTCFPGRPPAGRFVLFFVPAVFAAVSVPLIAGEETDASASAGAKSSAQAPAAQSSKPDEKKEGGQVSAVDPSTGAVTFNGISWNIADMPGLDQRYEQFLMESQSVMKDELEYYKKLESLLVLLTGNPFGRSSPQPPSQQNYQLAFTALKAIEARPDWRKYDGGISGQIAAQIEAMAIKLRESRDPKGQASGFEARRRLIESQLSFLTTTANSDPKRAAFDAEKKAQLLAEKDRLTSERAKYETESLPALAMAKGQFQVFIFTLLAQRRFQHVIVAAKTYQALVADGDLGLSQKNNPMARQMNVDTDPPLTTISVAQAAGAAHEDVRRAVDAYRNQVAANMLDAADRSLLQAFVLGEYMPEVRALPPQARKQVLAIRQNRKQMNSALNVRDYARAEEKLNALEKLAPDFDPAMQRMLIRKAKMESDAHLMKAKTAFFEGDKPEAEKALRKAAEIWPTNPNLDKIAGDTGLIDGQMQLKKELDDLFARQDFRAIAEKGEKFAGAVFDDPARQAKLREAGKNLGEIERALGRYDEMGKSGSPYAAWEALDEVAAKFPKDEKVALAYQEATVRASDYIGGVRQAQLNEKNGEDVAALSGYLAALSKNPSSDRVKLSVKSLSEKLLKSEPSDATP